MCSIGHHDHADKVRAPRRHLDDTARRALRTMPRAKLAAVKANKTDELRREVQMQEADALATQHGALGEQFELVPAGQPDHDFMNTPQGPEPPYWARD